MGNVVHQPFHPDLVFFSFFGTSEIILISHEYGNKKTINLRHLLDHPYHLLVRDIPVDPVNREAPLSLEDQYHPDHPFHHVVLDSPVILVDLQYLVHQEARLSLGVLMILVRLFLH